MGHGTFKNRIILATALSLLCGCSTMKSMLALNAPSEKVKPIENPFGDFYSNASNQNKNVILRTKKGDRSMEVEIPGNHQDLTDFVVPVSPQFRETTTGTEPDRSPASYTSQKPTFVDREITSTFPQTQSEDEGRRREVEADLGVIPAESDRPQQDSSYLAGLDHVKQLYKGARYEAALLEIDAMLKEYQTDAKLYEMRGTVLDRLGHSDLAIKSWNQALRFNPSNEPLKRFVDKKQQKRGLASP